MTDTQTAEFDPLRYAGPSTRRRLGAQAKAAKRSFPAAIKLMCRQCMGFSDDEVRACSANHCALWEIRKRYFKVTT